MHVVHIPDCTLVISRFLGCRLLEMRIKYIQDFFFEYRSFFFNTYFDLSFLFLSVSLCFRHSEKWLWLFKFFYFPICFDCTLCVCRLCCCYFFLLSYSFVYVFLLFTLSLSLSSLFHSLKYTHSFHSPGKILFSLSSAYNCFFYGVNCWTTELFHSYTMMISTEIYCVLSVSHHAT